MIKTGRYEELMGELLSVIIPTYNKALYIRQCLDSVISQSYRNIEIIIVDDCSKDETTNIIQEYQSKHSNIQAIFLKKNMGVSHARNVGIQAAHGKYITMLDSDDFYFSANKLKNEMTLLMQHNGHGIAYSYRWVVDHAGSLVFSTKRNLQMYVSGYSFYHFLTEKNACNFVQRDYVVPKEVVLRVGGYREGESYYEDYDLLLRLLKELPLLYTGEDGTAYRVVSNGLSSSRKTADAKQFRVPQQIKKRYIPQLQGWQRIKAWILWGGECFRLEIRILGRKIKRLIKL